MKQVEVGKIKLSNKEDFVLIAGLNVLEDGNTIKEVVEECKQVTEELDIPFIFKASYDKANRSSFDSFRGPGVDEGLDILKKIKVDYRVPVISDVHTSEEIFKASKVLDLLQIPAFLHYCGCDLRGPFILFDGDHQADRDLVESRHN